MNKVVVNKQYGGFSLSQELVVRLYETAPELFTEISYDPTKQEVEKVAVVSGYRMVYDIIEVEGTWYLVRLVEEMGDQASGTMQIRDTDLIN